MVQIAALIYSSLMIIIIVFQFCLAIGLPWGEASMGGKFPGKYPIKMRIVAMINMIVLMGLVFIVTVYSDLWFPQFKSLSNIGIWIVVAFSLISLILNIITPSRIERKIWAPVTAVQLIASVIVTFH